MKVNVLYLIKKKTTKEKLSFLFTFLDIYLLLLLFELKKKKAWRGRVTISHIFIMTVRF